MILGVILEMTPEAVDPLGQQRDLDLGRPRVLLMGPVLRDDVLFFLLCQCHASPPCQCPGLKTRRMFICAPSRPSTMATRSSSPSGCLFTTTFAVFPFSNAPLSLCNGLPCLRDIASATVTGMASIPARARLMGMRCD